MRFFIYMSTFEIKTGKVVSETLNRLVEQEVIVEVLKTEERKGWIYVKYR